jgi:hypothetical protein
MNIGEQFYHAPSNLVVTVTATRGHSMVEVGWLGLDHNGKIIERGTALPWQELCAKPTPEQFAADRQRVAKLHALAASAASGPATP